MINLSPENLIKSLPLDKKEQDSLLTLYNSSSEGKQFEILRVCWDAFHSMRKVMKEVKYNDFLMEVGEGKRQLTTDIMQEVDEAVWKDIEGYINGDKGERDKIDQIREQLQSIIQTSTH